jgi:hypothetical protein
MDPIILEALVHFGLPGTMLALFSFLYWSKDRELKSERDARLADAQKYGETSLKLQSQVIDAVHNLSMVFDELRKSRR